MLEKTVESSFDCKEIQSVNPKGNQSWIFIGKAGAEVEGAILWPPDAKNWLISKDPDAGKEWRQEEKGTIEDEMVGCHHWLNRHEFGQAPVVGDGQGAWHAAVHGVAKSQTRLRDWTELTEIAPWVCDWEMSTFEDEVPNSYTHIPDPCSQGLEFPVQFSCSYCSVTISWPTFCTPMDCSTPGSSVLYYLRVCSISCPFGWWCYLTISSSASPSPFAFNLSQHQCLFKCASSSHQVAKVLELQLQHQSFQCY